MMSSLLGWGRERNFSPPPMSSPSHHSDEDEPLPDFEAIPEHRPDWDSFETYKGEETGQMPSWAQTLFHWFMLGLSAVLVFAISGGLLTLISYRFTSRFREMGPETHQEAVIRFIVFGTVGLIAALVIYLRKIRPTIT